MFATVIITLIIVSGFIAAFVALLTLIEWLFNKVLLHYKLYYTFIDWMFNRKEFKKWLNNKL